GTTLLRKATGKDIDEAIIELQRKLSRYLFWGHSEVIVFGKAAADKGIRPYLDFFLRYLQFREHAYVYVTPGRAISVLDLQPLLERSTSEELREMGNMKLGMRVTLKRLAQMIEGESQSAVLTVVDPVSWRQVNKPAQMTTAIQDVAVFDKDKLSSMLDRQETIGLLLLRNELETMNFSFRLQDTEGVVGVHLIQANARFTPKITPFGEWRMEVDIQASGDLIQNTTNTNNMSHDFIRKAKEAWKLQLVESVESSLANAQKKLQIDAFDFAVLFRKHYPREWAKNKQQWDTIFRELPVDVTVRTEITRVGKSGLPQGMPADKIRKK
ncbi:Ger(x)C family spore germination protein, partial [Paenibacillus whitsoniae]